MEELNYVAQALLDRLQDDGVRFSVLEENLVLAVPREALPGVPRRLARFSQDFDLHLVQLRRAERQRWQFVLAWSDEVGRPSFLCVDVLADYCRAGRRYLRSEELLTGAPDARFIYRLAEGVERQEIDEARGAALSSLWHASPRGAIERIGRFWRQRRDVRLLAQAAKQGDWRAVRPELARLRRGLRRAVLPGIGALPGARLRERPATVAFIGAPDSTLRERVARDMAPAGIRTVDRDFVSTGRGVDMCVVFDASDSYRPNCDETIAVERLQPAGASAVRVETALLRWLALRVERRHPETVVGANPLAARILQFALRHKVPVLADFMSTLLNTGIACRLRSPLLMPHPYGIFIHRNAVLGSRVTVMHQVTIGSQHPADPGVPVIEDNVFIGAGAKVLGPVRIGRGATVGANAVVTRDVPSHCTVVGANRILGMDIVAAQRQRQEGAVVNT